MRSVRLGRHASVAPAILDVALAIRISHAAVPFALIGRYWIFKKWTIFHLRQFVTILNPFSFHLYSLFRLELK
jgi:hypothetical protein